MPRRPPPRRLLERPPRPSAGTAAALAGGLLLGLLAGALAGLLRAPADPAPARPAADGGASR